MMRNEYRPPDRAHIHARQELCSVAHHHRRDPARRRCRLQEPRVNRISEIAAVTYAVRHCSEHGCRKCTARARWGRRKKWHPRKNPNRRLTGRK